MQVHHDTRKYSVHPLRSPPPPCSNWQLHVDTYDTVAFPHCSIVSGEHRSTVLDSRSYVWGPLQRESSPGTIKATEAACRQQDPPCFLMWHVDPMGLHLLLSWPPPEPVPVAVGDFGRSCCPQERLSFFSGEKRNRSRQASSSQPEGTSRLSASVVCASTGWWMRDGVLRTTADSSGLLT